MKSEKGSYWSALVWMLNGVLLVTWLYGSGLAYQKDGIGQGLLALFVPPYGIYVAYAHGVEEKKPRATGPGSWIQPSVQHLVDDLEKQCLNSEADREQSGLTDDQYAEFCLCIARSAVAMRNPKEARYQKRTGQATAQFNKRLTQAQKSCATTATFVGLPRAPEAVEPPSTD